MELNKNCTVIKTSVLNELHKKISKLENEKSEELRQQMSKYEEQIQKLKDLKKPEEINIILSYDHKTMRSNPYNYGSRYYNEYKSLTHLDPTFLEVTSSFNFAEGIRMQLNRIRNLVFTDLKKHWKYQKTELERSMEDRLIMCSKENYKVGLNDAIEVIEKNSFKSKKTLIKLIKEVIKTSDNE